MKDPVLPATPSQDSGAAGPWTGPFQHVTGPGR